MEGDDGLRCLRCSARLEAEFGIVACAQCGAVMMIDIDGRLQLADEAPAEEPAAPEMAEAIAEEPPLSEEALSFEPGVIEENPIETEPEVAAQDASWFEQGLDQVLAPPSELSANEPDPQSDPQLATTDFSDVENFGNQDVDAGALQFELVLANLDHADLQNEVFEILADPRFFLNVKELREQLQQGILTVPGLSAARTSLIVTRLRHLKISIQWRQKLYEV